MVNPMHAQLSRRENQIMDVIYQLGEASAADILARLPDPPSNSAIRTLLTILEEKGHLTHRRVSGKFVYRPSVPAENARRSALSQLLRTFFGGSPPQMVAALLSSTDLSDAELDELADLIQKAKAQEKEVNNDSLLNNTAILDGFDLIAVAALKGALIVLLVLIGLRLSRLSAAARHWIWVLTIGALLIMPIWTALSPAWRVAILPDMTNAKSGEPLVFNQSQSAKAISPLPEKISGASAITLLPDATLTPILKSIIPTAKSVDPLAKTGCD